MNLKSVFCGLSLVFFSSFSLLSQSQETATERYTSEENEATREEDLSEERADQSKSTEPQLPKEQDPRPEPPPKDHFPTVIGLVSPSQYFSRHAFVADKSRRTLSIWRFTGSGPQFIEAHPMDKGKVDGDKHILGDKKTPEGIYFFTRSYRGQQLDFNEYGSRAFVMDYPNFFDKRAQKTGSGIWLHAVPDSKSLFRGSRGCVVVRNEIVQKLERFIDLKKTPIIVVEKADYLPTEEFEAFTKKWFQYLDDWKVSWESKDHARYIQFYHSEFESQRRNKTDWELYKKSLAEKYEFIQVQIKEPMVFIHKDSAMIRFLQDYTSDQNSDFGEKTLYLQRENERFKIIGEEWAPLQKTERDAEEVSIAEKNLSP